MTSKILSRNVLGRLLAASFALLVVLMLGASGLGMAALSRVDAATTRAVERNLAWERMATDIYRMAALNAERYKAMALSSEPEVGEILSADIEATRSAYHALLFQLHQTLADPASRQQLAEGEDAHGKVLLAA